MIPITALYGGLLTLLFLFLTGYVIAGRGKYKLSLGDGGDPDMIGRIRAHGNFVEFVPLALILLAILELNAAPALLLHGLGATLLVARILHGFGLTQTKTTNKARFYGALFTLLMMLAAAMACLWVAF